MYTLFVILSIVVAVLLTIVVLVQESKGGGLASNVSGANSVLGVRKTTDFIERATWVLVSLLVVFTVAASFFDKPENQDPTSTVTNLTDPVAPASAPAQPSLPNAATPQKAATAPTAPTSVPKPAQGK